MSTRTASTVEQRGAQPHHGAGALLLLIGTLAGCGVNSDLSNVCTAIFGYQSVVVVDSTGAPLNLTWTVTDTVVRTGTVLSIAQVGFPEGRATVFTDSNIHDISQLGEPLKVGGVSGARHFSSAFQFSGDGCHFKRDSGPDTVVAH